MIYVYSCPVTLGKRPRSNVRARVAYVRERNFRRHARRNRGDPGTYGGSRGQRSGGTELEFDPWCSRWDAILFIVLIISEYIVRTRHAAPRSRIREIYAIETTPSPPPSPAGPLLPRSSSCVRASQSCSFFPSPFSCTRRPAVPSKHPHACVDARNLCAEPK